MKCIHCNGCVQILFNSIHFVSFREWSHFIPHFYVRLLCAIVWVHLLAATAKNGKEFCDKVINWDCQSIQLCYHMDLLVACLL